jgi:hypothetical protein
MNNIKVLSFNGFILSNLICYLLFSQIIFIFQNADFNNTIFMIFSQIIHFILFSFIFIIFEILSFLSLFFLLKFKI